MIYSEIERLYECSLGYMLGRTLWRSKDGYPSHTGQKKLQTLGHTLDASMECTKKIEIVTVVTSDMWTKTFWEQEVFCLQAEGGDFMVNEFVKAH